MNSRVALIALDILEMISVLVVVRYIGLRKHHRPAVDGAVPAQKENGTVNVTSCASTKTSTSVEAVVG